MIEKLIAERTRITVPCELLEAHNLARDLVGTATPSGMGVELCRNINKAHGLVQRARIWCRASLSSVEEYLVNNRAVHQIVSCR